jgi:hypothetical protein
VVTRIISLGRFISHDLNETIRSASKPIVGMTSETSLSEKYRGVSGRGIGSKAVPIMQATAHFTSCHTLPSLVRARKCWLGV